MKVVTKLQNVLNVLRNLPEGEYGLLVFSQLKQEMIQSINPDLEIPLASAAKLAIAFCVVKFIEEGRYTWNEKVSPMRFDPREDSQELYPHFQQRSSLLLREAVEMMIACHDRFVAQCVVNVVGGWEVVNATLQKYYPTIHVNDDPRDGQNKGQLSEVFELFQTIMRGYTETPELWVPIINGLVRQQDKIEALPAHIINQMTGGLNHAVINIGVIGEFSKHPFLFALGARNLPNRATNTDADESIQEALQLLYDAYASQETLLIN